MTPLICNRCGLEIVPGTLVEFVGPVDPEGEERRIFTEDELLVVHKECPEVTP